jgi:hypothetical protein
MQQRLAAIVVCLTLLGGGAQFVAAAKLDWRWLIVCDGPDADVERGALIKALRLLPHLPVRVAVIDLSEAKPEVQQVLRGLDAFITVGSPVVYVVKQSALLRGAIGDSSLHTHALATVLWHEMAHAEGADEREARRREQALWTRYVRDQRVEIVAALRYLAALDRRPDDRMLASR